MFFNEIAKQASLEVAGNWNVQRSNTVRYTAESQMSFMLRRRQVSNMSRAFANHFHRRLQYIGDRSPNANLIGDKNIIHGKADEHNVDDDEPLTSADFGRRHRPSRNYPDMGGRKS